MPSLTVPSWLIVGSPTLSELENRFVDGPQGAEPVFAEPWEANAFALVIAMHKEGLFTWSEWADTLSSAIKQQPDDTPYYRCWLLALEIIASKKGLIAGSEVENRAEEWKLALAATPHGQPIELGNAGGNCR